jgi:hypothetical protein
MGVKPMPLSIAGLSYLYPNQDASVPLAVVAKTSYEVQHISWQIELLHSQLF